MTSSLSFAPEKITCCTRETRGVKGGGKSDRTPIRGRRELALTSGSSSSTSTGLVSETVPGSSSSESPSVMTAGSWRAAARAGINLSLGGKRWAAPAPGAAAMFEKLGAAGLDATDSLVAYRRLRTEPLAAGAAAAWERNGRCSEAAVVRAAAAGSGRISGAGVLSVTVGSKEKFCLGAAATGVAPAPGCGACAGADAGAWAATGSCGTPGACGCCSGTVACAGRLAAGAEAVADVDTAAALAAAGADAAAVAGRRAGVGAGAGAGVGAGRAGAAVAVDGGAAGRRSSVGGRAAGVAAAAAALVAGVAAGTDAAADAAARSASSRCRVKHGRA